MGDKRYTKEELYHLFLVDIEKYIEVTGGNKKVAAEFRAECIKLRADNEALRNALEPLPELINELVNIATNHGVQYPHQERYVEKALDVSKQAADSLKEAK